MANAWRPTGDHVVPPPGVWGDGWEVVNELATDAVIRALADRGLTYVNLVTGGTAHRAKDMPIGALLSFNRDRSHGSINYFTPVEYEAADYASRNAVGPSSDDVVTTSAGTSP